MRKAFGLFLILLTLLVSPLSLLAASSQAAMISAPVTFEENRGQAPPIYRYLYRGGDATALFSETGVDLILPNQAKRGASIGLTFLGRRSDARLRAGDRLQTVSHYFIGDSPTKWIRGVPHDSQVVYDGIYPGIDLIFHGRDARLEQDFRLEPGADPRQIRFSIERADAIALDPSGDLRISVGSGTLFIQKPEAYQETAAGRRAVTARFAITPQGSVEFRIGAYDSSRELIIDPVFSFSTYLVGSNGSTVTAVTTDSRGNVFVTGYTGSGFPIVNGVQPTINGTNNAFVSKFDPTGHTLLYSTYLGGAGVFGNAGNYGSAIAIDPTGNIVVAGTSGANDFPHAGSVPALTCQTNAACFFIASLSPDGSILNYSGLIGGLANIPDTDYGNQGRLAIDASGNAYLAGITDDPNFQITPGTLSNTVPGYPYNSTCVLKVDTTGALVYSTIVPGTLPLNPADISLDVFVPSGIAVDTNGQVTIAGTAGPGLPSTAGVVQATFPNDLNNTNPNAGFVLQLNATASAINYATYVTGTDWVLGMAVDNNGNLYLTGSTGETNLPVSANAYQKAILQYQSSGFVVKMNGNGTAIPAATYLEGSAGAGLSGIALDSNSNVFIGGGTSSTDFPLVDPFVSLWVFGTSNSDMVLAGLSPDLSSLIFGSFLSSTDQTFSAPQFYGLTVDSSDNLIVVGETLTTDFPTTPNSFQPTAPGQSGQYQRGFVTKIDLAIAAPSVCPAVWTVNFGTVVPGESSTQVLNITNCGNATLVIAKIVSSLPSVTVQNGCGSVAPAAICPVSLTFTAQNTSPVTGTLTLNDNAVITPQIIQLSGQGLGGGIGLAGASAGSTSATVTAGGTATYTLVIGGHGIAGTATIGCASAPKGANCSVPGTMTISASSQESFTVTVSTTPRALNSSVWSNQGWVWAIAVVGLFAVPRREKKHNSRWRKFLSLALLLTVSSCGGGGGSGGGTGGVQTNPNGTPAGSYVLSLTATVGTSSESLPVTLTVQ